MGVVGEPGLEPGHLGDGVDEGPVPLPPLVEHARGASPGGSPGRQVVRHVHDAVAEHGARHQGKPGQGTARGTRLVVLGAGGHAPGWLLLLYARRGRRRWRRRGCLVLRARRQRQRTYRRTWGWARRCWG